MGLPCSAVSWGGFRPCWFRWFLRVGVDGADSSLLHRGQKDGPAFVVVWLVFQMVRCWRGGEWWVWCCSWSGDVV